MEQMENRHDPWIMPRAAASRKPRMDWRGSSPIWLVRGMELASVGSMRNWRSIVGPLAGLALLAVGLGAKSGGKPRVSSPLVYTGMSDASAACSLGTNRFVVCDDESNLLRVYPREGGGPPARTFSLSSIVLCPPRENGSDLECAARLDGVMYWMSSRAKNRGPKSPWPRHHFFGLEERVGTEPFSLVGRPYHRLISDLATAPQLQSFGLLEASTRGPSEPGALNLEGLAAGPGHSLLIGFRNPVPEGKALLVPLLKSEARARRRAGASGRPHPAGSERAWHPGHRLLPGSVAHRRGAEGGRRWFPSVLVARSGAPSRPWLNRSN